MYFKVQKSKWKMNNETNFHCLNNENEYETQIQVQHLWMKMLQKYKNWICNSSQLQTTKPEASWIAAPK